MKKIVVLFILIQCISCKTDTKKTLTPVQIAAMTADSIANAKLAIAVDSIAQARANDSLAIVQAEARLKTAAQRLPQTNWSVFKNVFYKHFVGKVNATPASMNMTFGKAEVNGNSFLEITIATPHQMYWFYLTDAHIQAAKQQKQQHLKLYPIQQTADSLSDLTASFTQSADFKGFALDLKSRQLIEFDFKENHSDEATELEYVNYSETKQVGKTRLLCAVTHVLPKDTTVTWYSLLANETFNASWEASKKTFKTFSKKSLKEIKETDENACGHCGLVSSTDEKIIMYNHRNNIVIEDFGVQNSGTSYGEFGCSFLQIDTKNAKILKEKDVFVKGWKDKMLEPLEKMGETPEDAQTIADRLQYGYFTNGGVVFMAPGNHGFYCHQFFVPFTHMKAALKPDFRATYVK